MNIKIIVFKSFKKIIDKLLKPYGFEVAPINNSMEIIKAEHANSKTFNFIQVGANDGVKFDDLYTFAVSNECEGIVIEPLEYYFQQLEKNYKNFPNIRAMKTAIHATGKEVDIYHVNPEVLNTLPEWAQGIGSVLPDQHQNTSIPEEHFITEKVKCMHLMDIYKQSDFKHLNLLQIDVEGYDFEVMKMIDFDIVKPSIIKYEHQSMDKDTKLKVKQFLEGNGYHLSPQRADTLAILND